MDQKSNELYSDVFGLQCSDWTNSFAQYSIVGVGVVLFFYEVLNEKVCILIYKL